MSAGDRTRYTVDLTPAEASELRTLVPAGTLRKKPARKRRETEDFTATVRRMLVRLADRAEGDVDQLPALVELAELAEQVLIRHVREAVDVGTTWTEIAERLGKTKQGAAQWFARRNGAPAGTGSQRQQNVDGQTTIEDFA